MADRCGSSQVASGSWFSNLRKLSRELRLGLLSGSPTSVTAAFCLNYVPSWQDLRRRVCGNVVVDLESLKQHTVYKRFDWQGGDNPYEHPLLVKPVPVLAPPNPIKQ